MHVLVTRPREDAVGLIAALTARGHQAVAEPLLDIVPRDDVVWPPGHDTAQALLVTSANGLRAFARLDARRALPVFAVGDASAAAARDLGFQQVESAAGDVADLAALVRGRLAPDGGPLLHPAAGKLAGDLQGRLAAAGFVVLRAVLYDAVPATALSPGCVSALRQGRLDAVALFSPRTAAGFRRLVEQAGLSQTCHGLTALCLSPAVAARIDGLPWRRVAVARRPDQAALLECLDALANDNR